MALWTLAGTLAALVAAFVVLAWRHTRTVRSEAMLAARVEEQDKELGRANKANATLDADRKAARRAVNDSVGDISPDVAGRMRSHWTTNVDASLGDNRNGAVLGASAGAGDGIAKGRGDEHDTEPNGRRLGERTGEVDVLGPSGLDDVFGQDDVLDNADRGNLRGKQ
jgi:hypothetical protein